MMGEARSEYWRLQGIYPVVELRLVAINEHGWIYFIHGGYWERPARRWSIVTLTQLPPGY